MPLRKPEGVVRRLRQLADTSASEADDAQLLRRFVEKRDDNAFAALVERYGPLVLGVCRRLLTDAHAADDAFQATFLILARKARALHGRTPLSSWLYGVASRVARKARGRSAAKGRPPTPNVPAPGRDPLAELSGRELCETLDNEIERLPERYRAPILLCCLQGLTRDEAARRLGWGVNTLRGRLERGRALLRERLRRRGIDLSAALVAATLAPAVASAALCGEVMASARSFAEGISMRGAATDLAGDLLARTAMIKFTQLGAALAVVLTMGLGGLAALRSDGDDPKAESPPPKKQETPAATATRTDRYGDPLPEGAVARLGTIRFNHGDRLNALHFTPDGRMIVSVGNGSARLWDTESGKELGQFVTGKPSWDDQTALSPDGKTMTLLDQQWENDTVRVWNLADGKALRAVTLPVRRNEKSVYRKNALSPDGRLCAIHTPKLVQVFDAETAKELCTIPRGGDEVRAAIFAGADRVVTAGKDQVIDVWEARTGKPVRQFAHGAPAEVLAASADGRLLAVMEHHNHAIDRLLDKDVIHVWDLPTGTRKRVLAAGPKRWFMRVRFSPNGKLLFAASSGTEGYETTVWNVETGERLHDLDTPALAVAASPDGSRLASGGMGQFDVWDLKSGRRLSSENSRHAYAAALFFAPAGDRICTIGFSSISAWDSVTGQRLRSFDVPGYNNTLPARVHSPDGRYAVTFRSDWKEMEVLIWDVASGSRLHTLRPPGTPAVAACAFAPDSSLLATLHSGNGSVVRVWNVQTGKEVHSFPESKAGWPGLLFFTPDGKTLLIAGKRVVGYEVASGKEVFSWRMQPLPTGPGPTAPLGGGSMDENDQIAWRTLTVSPDGSTAACILAGGGFGAPVENRIMLCDARTGKVRLRWGDSGIPSPSWEQLRFSPDSRLLASTDGAVTHVWEAATGKEVRTFLGHRGEVRTLAFNADGRFIASGASDSTVLIWDLAPPANGKRGEKELAAWWADLIGNDAARAHDAVWELAAASHTSVPFLRERLRPVTDASMKEVREFIADLDNSTFGVREKSYRRLHSLGLTAVPVLRQALEKAASPEVRTRIERLLEGVSNGPVTGEPLRTLRALAALEHAATPEAQRLLRELADGAAGAWLTQEAKAVYERLAPPPAP
jgi:RNA polymerase sigma factor (sigma-70 family)